MPANKAPNRRWRDRASLALLMTWTVVIAILAGGLAAGYYGMRVLSQNKLADSWAIMFLELEHEGTDLAGRLAELGEAPAAPGDAFVQVTAGGLLKVESGALGDDLTGDDFKLDRGAALALPPLAVLSAAGETFLAQPAGPRRLRLRRLPAARLALNPERPADLGALYLLTREGRLIYSSDPKIVEANVTGRQLVQRFIAAPLRQGQLEFTGNDGVDRYGFFAEVPRSNVIMFSEVARAAAMASVRALVLRFLFTLAAILVGVVVIIQWPLSRLMAPVQDLARMAVSVERGQFDVKPKTAGFGELAVLTTAFSSMATGLIERDKKMEALTREQVEKARLEGELAVAKGIQENLLPTAPLPREAGLEIAAEYLPAAECAGDWYHYTYDAARRETIVVIADVSGHGAGSSMFTAMIAGLFVEFSSRSDVAFSCEEFGRQANEVIHRLGRQNWHATMMMVRYVAGSRQLDIFNAGHLSPMVRRATPETGRRTTPRAMPSTPLGTTLDFQPMQATIPFGPGDSLLLYTDGLIEAENVAGRQFGRRRTHDAFLEGSHIPLTAVTSLIDKWRAYCNGAPVMDDVCTIVIKAAA